MSNNKLNRFWRGLLYLLIGLALAVFYVIWKIQAFKSDVLGFQPEAMALAQHTPKDVIGDLGGMKVRIPRACAEYVEYDSDPAWGEKRKGPAPERTFESKLKSFGMDMRFPDMACKASKELREDYRKYILKKENPWVRISINAGEIYPSMGSYANDGLAKELWEKSEYWFANFERAPLMDVAGLDAYVVAGTDPRTGNPARSSDSTNDIYIHKTANYVDTYISCGRTSVPGGVTTCRMHFGLEPKAKVRVQTAFNPTLLPKWREIRQITIDFLTGFEANEKAFSSAK